MANATPCLTPGAIFHTRVGDRRISCTVDLPHALQLSADDAAVLETLVHNAMETVLAAYVGAGRAG